MHTTKDLHIQRELLPLFDYSLNTFSKNRILEILETPLPSTAEILQRQHILQGFSENRHIVKDYSYTVLYLNEVHFFLNDPKIEDLSKAKLNYKLFASKQKKTEYTGKFNQLILFFHRLESKYFTRLNLEAFPEAYVLSIKRILRFLSHF